MAGLSAFAAALNTDVEWLREHTRYLTLAQSWIETGQTQNRLQSGPDITDAKIWAYRRPMDAPQVTELHLEYIRASEAAEAEEASKEWQQLAEIDIAQKAREEVLSKAENATSEKLIAGQKLVRRTFGLGSFVVLLLAVLVVSIWFYAQEQHNFAEETLKQMEKQDELAVKLGSGTARADSFINLVSSNPSGRRAMEKICLEAIQVTSTLSSTSGDNEFKRPLERF